MPSKWYRIRPQICRFGLRGLLVAVTVFACLFAWWSYRARQQRSAVAALTAIGGEITYSHESDYFGHAPATNRPPVPDWLWNLLGPDYFVSVHSIRFVAPESNSSHPIFEVYDHDLLHLAHLPDVQYLDLDLCPISDDGLVHVRHLQNLKILTLSYTNVTDEGLPHLYTLDALEIVRLWDTNVTDSGAQKLRQRLPNLTIERFEDG